MLRHFLFVSQTISNAIAHTFNATLGYDGNLSKDKIGVQTREIQMGKALKFNGTNQFVQLPNVPAFNLTNFTITAWIKAGSIQNTRIFSKDNNADPGIRKLISLKGATLGLLRPAGGVLVGSQFVFVEGPTVLNVGQHYHISLVRKDGEYLRLYVDGVLVSQMLSALVLGQIDSNIGPTIGNWRSQSGSGEHFDGEERDVRVFNKEKTTAEINNIYTGGTDTDGLIAQYKMDEGSGTSAYDSSGNGHHGTLVNGVSRITKTDGFGADFQNQVGYTNNAGVLVPRNENNITQDVQGNPLQFAGRVKYDARLNGMFVSFDGINDYGIANIPQSNLTASITVGGWVRFKLVTAGFKPFINQYVAPNGFHLAISSGTIVGAGRSGQSGSSDYRVVGNTVATANRWYHVMLVIDAQNPSRKLYVDRGLNDTLITTNEGSKASGSPFYLGTFTPSDFFCNCDLYDIRLYNKVKNLSEIDNIHNGGIDLDGLVAQYNGDDGSGVTLRDSSGNGHHGTLINGATRGTGPQGSTARQTRGHSVVGGVTIPRNEAIPAQDVLGNTLQNPTDGHSLLPGGQVDFNPGLAPELIRKTVPTNYTFGNVLPLTMTKVTAPNKEKDFIVKI